MTPAAAATRGGLQIWTDLVATPERAELTESAARHFAQRFPLDAGRARFDSTPLEPTGWTEVVSSGYLAIGVPEALGGVGTLADLVALIEEAGRALLPVPLLATVAALRTRLAFGLPIDLDRGRPEALGESGEAVLDGQWAEHVVIVRPGGPGGPGGPRGSGGPGAVLHEIDVRARPPAAVYRHLDPGRPLAAFGSDGEPVASTEAGIDDVLAGARTAVAADLVGVAAGALDRAVRHSLDRQQFGRPIGSFQAVKHLLANLYVAIERARSLTRAAAIAVENPNEVDVDAAVLALLAKAAAGEAASAATAGYVQVLGAMGQTFEADAHLFFRRAQQTTPFLGTPTDCYARAVLLQRDDS